MTKWRLLLAGDDPDVAAVLCLAVEEALPAAVTCVDTQPKALEALDQCGFDLAVVDVLLPGGSGFAVAEHAVANGVPALLTTGHPTEIARCADYAFPCLIKPFLPAKLIEEARTTLQRSEENVAQIRRACASVQITMRRSMELAERTSRNVQASRAEVQRSRARRLARDER